MNMCNAHYKQAIPDFLPISNLIFAEKIGDFDI